GGNRDHRPVDRGAVVLDRLGDRVEHRHAVHIASLAAGRDAAHDPGAGAVVQALPGQIDRLAPGDALDDERRGLVDQDAHTASAARRAASFNDTVRSAYG